MMYLWISQGVIPVNLSRGFSFTSQYSKMSIEPRLLPDYTLLQGYLHTCMRAIRVVALFSNIRVWILKTEKHFSKWISTILQYITADYKANLQKVHFYSDIQVPITRRGNIEGTQTVHCSAVLLTVWHLTVIVCRFPSFSKYTNRHGSVNGRLSRYDCDQLGWIPTHCNLERNTCFRKWMDGPHDVHIFMSFFLSVCVNEACSL